MPESDTFLYRIKIHYQTKKEAFNFSPQILHIEPSITETFAGIRGKSTDL